MLTTPGALEAADAAGDDLLIYVRWHARGDWGDVSDADGRANDRALADGTWLF